ncbi:MAG: hypothetical protein CVV42_17335 [Candidatus Riflebacteria bacterium HGW-Riflebacteria-2]|jgi:hypothetical protein|nr:MAG: hypothetical protein CVV42_17335 [Candidatus Riflebacteria bacterium HGW-Riflebacteria-2]
MAGAFTHICLVNEVLNRIRELPENNFPEEIKDHLIANKHFLELGSVAPDYPLLDYKNTDSENWSGCMHAVSTGDFLQVGAFRARKMGNPIRGKYIAWFLGYLSHYTADVCLHPIVEKLVGHYYDGNQVAHRECEMYQDVYIVKKKRGQELIEAEILDESILKCSESENRSFLDIQIKMVWQELLATVYNQYSYTSKPEIDRWHSKYLFKIDRLAEEGSQIFGFAWLLNHFGLAYPWSTDKKDKFLQNLPSPDPNISVSFDQAFEKTVQHCLENFISFSNYISGQYPRITARFGDYSMDSGMDKNGKFLYW